jgi:hypothetical protein
MLRIDVRSRGIVLEHRSLDPSATNKPSCLLPSYLHVGLDEDAPVPLIGHPFWFRAILPGPSWPSRSLGCKNAFGHSFSANGSRWQHRARGSLSAMAANVTALLQSKTPSTSEVGRNDQEKKQPSLVGFPMRRGQDIQTFRTGTSGRVSAAAPRDSSGWGLWKWTGAMRASVTSPSHPPR